ncbi:hypothetical protein QP868_08735 [Brevibacterium sp. UMB1308A]|uniref:hypothetical protein n=1 Tax=Brevibacterium sp. UMB1308A TaxID=3050608 RepID=UPI00254B2783|nr:hypothetical protein [Brevibacterium sp. UMB1308A]MDK8346829.1 hypothetical protein [Brevibacterium sp. UMB1308B]MDK8713977.1 hypothetical protein [Brevibacterium sp. UMB1308A]
MKKLLLAPAVAVVAGSIAFAGSAAYATPTPAPPTGEPNTSETQKPSASGTQEPSASPTEKAASDITVEGKDTLTVAELDKGVSYKVTGLKPGQKLTVYLGTALSANAEGKATADENGNATVSIKSMCGDDVSPKECWNYPELSLMLLVDGKFVKDHKGVQKIKVSDASISGKLDKDKVTVEELANKKAAPVYSGTGLEPNKEYTAKLFPSEDKDGIDPLAEITFKADDKGNFSVPLATSAEVAKKAVGEIAVLVYGVEDGMRTLPVVNFTVTEAPKEEAPGEEAAEYGLKVSPKEVTPADFVNKDKGVQLVVTGLKPNEKFNYSVSKQDGGKVENLFKEVQADKNGVWSHTVYGIKGSNGLDGFLGTYKVTIKSEEGVLTDSFKVTNTPGKKDEAKPGDKGGDKDKGDGKNKGEAKGGDNNSGKSNNAKGNDGKSSNTLPRTGMELSGLIAGGALLTVGAATVLVTRRRTK